MARKYLAFDIETAKVIPGEGFDWQPWFFLSVLAKPPLAGGGARR